MQAGNSLWYDGSVEDLPPQLEEAIEDYVDLSHGRSIAVLPIRRPERVVEGDVHSKETVQREDLSKREIIGALIIEQIESQVAPDALRSRCDLVYEHAARALNNSMSHSDLFLMPVWRFLGRATWLFRGSAFPKTMTVLALVAVALLALFLVRINLDLEANGTLQPAVQRQVFAHVDGEVEEVYVDHGDQVKQGQPLLKLRNRELEIEIADLQGQLDAARESIMALSDQVGRASRAGDALETSRLMGQERESVKRKETLEAQLRLVHEKEKQLIRTSPIDGVVMDWHLKERLRARPVVTGQVLVNVADPRGDWELELFMPEKRMKYLDDAFEDSGGAALRVDYIQLMNPSIDHTGKLSIEDVHYRAELDPTDGAVVKLRVKPDTLDDLSLWTGSKVIADVVCGKRSAAFVWFHEVVEWVQANVIF